jgi:hypothetical protein
MFSEFLPEPDCTILEVFVNPEGCNVGRVVGMPILITLPEMLVLIYGRNKVGNGGEQSGEWR